MPMTARRRHAALAAFVLLLVVVAFARAHFASSTGIHIAGDGADYEAMAAGLTLEGRAPFVYRPAVPLLVGALFAGNLTLGFALVCALAMVAALYAAGTLAPDRLAGYGIAAILFFNYQVLFAAANPARIDVVVLAAQLGFVALALRRNTAMYFTLLPLCALLKESMLLSLAALALVALPRDKKTLLRAAASGVGFLLVHAAVRAASNHRAHMPPYNGEVPALTALRQMLASNLSALTPLDMFVAWSGLCLVALWLVFGGGDKRRDPVLPAVAAFLLVFPLALVTDVHRAWFELLAPLLFFLLLPRLSAENRATVYPALALTLAASVIPYAVRSVADDHLFLLILEDRWSAMALLGLVASLGLATAALACAARRVSTPAGG